MAVVTGITAQRMQEIVDTLIVAGFIDANGFLMLEKHDGSLVNAGYAKGNDGKDGTDGDDGDPGPPGNPFAVTSLTTQDLNSLTTAGWYYQGSISDATLARNYPIASRPYYIEVVPSGTNLLQRAVSAGTQTSRSFNRIYDGTTWSSWYETSTHGTTIQSGTDLIDVVSPGTTASKTVTFPVAFTSTPNVVVTPVGTNPAAVSPLTVASVTTTSFVAYGQRPSGSTDISFYWIATI